MAASGMSAKGPAAFSVRARRWGLRVIFALSVALGAAARCAAASHGFEYVGFAASNPAQSKQVWLRGQLFRPQGEGPFPGVILMHGCGGWQPAVQRTLQSYADVLVDNGFAVLNLDSFGPRNNAGGEVCESLQSLTDARSYRIDDAFDAMRYLRGQDFIDPHNIFLMGQSNGGSVAIRAAMNGDLRAYGGTPGAFRAVVAFYPWCGAFGGRNVTLVSPLLIFAGAQDDWTPPDECLQARASGATLELKVYPQAAHSFDVDVAEQRYLGKWLGRDEYAARDSRQRMLGFFKKQLVTMPGASDRVRPDSAQ